MNEQNCKLLDDFRKIHDLLHKVNAVFVPGNDQANTEISKALRDTARWLEADRTCSTKPRE